jgi:hypothetical protein
VLAQCGSTEEFKLFSLFTNYNNPSSTTHVRFPKKTGTGTPGTHGTSITDIPMPSQVASFFNKHKTTYLDYLNNHLLNFYTAWNE